MAATTTATYYSPTTTFTAQAKELGIGQDGRVKVSRKRARPTSESEDESAKRHRRSGGGEQDEVRCSRPRRLTTPTSTINSREADHKEEQNHVKKTGEEEEVRCSRLSPPRTTPSSPSTTTSSTPTSSPWRADDVEKQPDRKTGVIVGITAAGDGDDDNDKEEEDVGRYTTDEGGSTSSEEEEEEDPLKVTFYPILNPCYFPIYCFPNHMHAPQINHVCYDDNDSTTSEETDDSYHHDDPWWGVDLPAELVQDMD